MVYQANGMKQQQAVYKARDGKDEGATEEKEEKA